MSEIINEILSREPFKSQLLNYNLVTINNFDKLVKGCHIKYITLNEELKTAGTFVSAHKNKSKRHLLIMCGIPWKLTFNKHWIFYKEPDVDFKKLMHLINEGKIKIIKNN
jgi:hypothetical protein